ncbi:hypothetical protein [Salinigranum sp. GCM10025319]|uniref:hypothetical protein n=1 Tax=Salinigranum sp. GCM10025319 TaxID=3252687 RepID=UPI003609E048
MRLARRRLLALLASGLAGCGGSQGGESRTDRSTTDRPTPRPTTGDTGRTTGPSMSPQSVSIGNTHATTEFVTVVVESGDETVFVGSRELVPGERYTIEDVLSTGGTYDVIVETASGSRATYRWTVVDGLDGLAVTLAEGIDFVRTVRCGSDCALADGSGDAPDVPLVGDGTGRWYAPAGIVLTNPSAGTVPASMTVSLYDATLLDYRYRIPRETQVVVPLTYRSGRYRVRVETAAGRVASDWLVPEVPARVVDVSTLSVGCGPANTQLRIENDDDRPHVLGVEVERDGERRFSERYTLAPGDRQTVVPVDESGRYTVRLRLDDRTERTWTWWACPPHGPGTLAVDATGTAVFRQAGL